MAKVCANCGMALLKDDTRFCGICGTLVASHPANVHVAASQQSTHPSTPSSPVFMPSQARSEKHVLHEQVAQQPPAYPARSTHSEKPPFWMSKLDSSSAGKSGSNVREPERSSEAARAVLAPAEQEKSRSASEKVGEMSATPLQQSSQRELRVKVWKPESGEDIEERDTVPLSTQVQSGQGAAIAERALSEIETAHLPATMQDASPASSPQYEVPSYPQRQIRPTLDGQPAPQVVGQVQPVPVNISSRASNSEGRGKSRLPLLRSLALLGILLAGGGLWIWRYQPFSVATITQPQQQFSDPRIGVSLLYPTGWKAQIDSQASTVHISDTSHTAQFDVLVSRQSGADVMQYLRHYAAQQGMTGVKSGQPLSFAGVSWLNMQGSVSQSGANYTEMLLATTHGSSLVILAQLAPLNIYNDEESSIFSHVRASFKFL